MSYRTALGVLTVIFALFSLGSAAHHNCVFEPSLKSNQLYDFNTFKKCVLGVRFNASYAKATIGSFE
jgi:hypothetical protein